MEKGIIAVMRYSVGLGRDGKVDKMLVDEEKWQIGVYILHWVDSLPSPQYDAFLSSFRC